MERQVPWVVPARLCHELQDEGTMDETAADEDEEEGKPREASVFVPRLLSGVDLLI